MCWDITVKLQNFNLGELRSECEALVVYETRWVEIGTGATPHTVIFCLAPGKRQIQPWSLLYKTMVRPHLKYCNQIWGPFNVADTK